MQDSWTCHTSLFYIPTIFPPDPPKLVRMIQNESLDSRDYSQAFHKVCQRASNKDIIKIYPEQAGLGYKGIETTKDLLQHALTTLPLPPSKRNLQKGKWPDYPGKYFLILSVNPQVCHLMTDYTFKKTSWGNYK